MWFICINLTPSAAEKQSIALSYSRLKSRSDIK